MKTLTFTGLEIAHLAVALVAAPYPDTADLDQDMREVITDRTIAAIRDTLSPEVLERIELLRENGRANPGKLPRPVRP